MQLKSTAVALALGILAAASASANSLTFQGVTFNTWAVDADTLGLSIINADVASGDWTGIQYLKAFELKDIVAGGEIATATISGPGAFTASVNNGLAAFGCTTGGTAGACFTSTPALALSNSLSWTMDFTVTSGSLNFAAPHLKVEFLTSATDSKKTGSLLSQTIPAVPEPETYAMLLAGLGVMGAIARRRKQSV